MYIHAGTSWISRCPSRMAPIKTVIVTTIIIIIITADYSFRLSLNWKRNILTKLIFPPTVFQTNFNKEAHYIHMYLLD